MVFKNNVYFNISKFGVDALTASEALLKSYPLTKVCLEIVGKDLLKTMEFGFFEPGYKIITQGDQGKDLYLLCNHLADVFVFSRLIVKMDAPALFGDKAIIDRNSTRNATISIADGDNSLVIKIPLGKFIRDFKSIEIDDSQFQQETQIYYNLFLEIQTRLFKYAEIQKQLWEEVNSKLKLLNVQLIYSILNKQEEKQWDENIWFVIKRYFETVHKTPWPKQTNTSMQSVTAILRDIFEKRFPRKTYKGSDQNYAYQKEIIFKRWFENLAEILVQVLPSDQIPISIGEVELFNPRIYQMRMHSLLVSIQRKFMFKKVPARMDVFDPEKLKAKRFFFGSGSEHEFNLDAYLKAIGELFILKKPNRVLAQVSQQIAQLSATCENEFNASVSNMQLFLEKVKRISAKTKTAEKADDSPDQLIGEWISSIIQGFKAYNKRFIGLTYTYAGVIRFSEEKVPKIADVVTACGSSAVLKSSVNKAFGHLLFKYGLKIPGLKDTSLQQIFYICQGVNKDIIPESQICAHYWIPLTNGTILGWGKNEFGTLKPGLLIGGSPWNTQESESEEEEKREWTLTIPKNQNQKNVEPENLILILPKKNLPWIKNSQPTSDDFKNEYMPILQWMINKYLEGITFIEEFRDTLLKQYSRIIETVVVEKKVREFENSKENLSKTKYKRILELVYDHLGIKLQPRTAITSSKLSKQLYNEILKQTKWDFPNIKTEEQGNKAYASWRFVQSEIVFKVFKEDFASKVAAKKTESSFAVLNNELKVLLTKKKAIVSSQAFHFNGDDNVISLTDIVPTDKKFMPHQALSIILDVLEVVEQNYHKLITDVAAYQTRLTQISSIQTKFDVNEVQSNYILEAISKLRAALEEEMNKKVKVKGSSPRI